MGIAFSEPEWLDRTKRATDRSGIRMTETYGLPQPLTGSETITIHQVQNGQIAKCTMQLSQLASILSSTSWAAGLSTTRPATAGVVWNDAGSISIS